MSHALDIAHRRLDEAIRNAETAIEADAPYARDEALDRVESWSRAVLALNTRPQRVTVERVRPPHDDLVVEDATGRTYPHSAGACTSSWCAGFGRPHPGYPCNADVGDPPIRTTEVLDLLRWALGFIESDYEGRSGMILSPEDRAKYERARALLGDVSDPTVGGPPVETGETIER